MQYPSSSFLPLGVATGIGSLPYMDTQTALALIAEHLPEIPHWPQLPQRGRCEHFIHQFLQPMVDCGLLQMVNDRWIVDRSRQTLPRRLTRFYERYLPESMDDSRWLSCCMPPRDAAIGFHAFLESILSGDLTTAGQVKGQIAGPLSVGLFLVDQEGRPIYYHDDLREVVVQTLAQNARCQATMLLQTGATPIIFVDDPAISAWGSRLYLSLCRETIQADLETIFSTIRSAGALCGLHACQAIDWSIPLSLNMHVLSLDAYQYGESLLAHIDALRRFLNAGGVVAWGMVPTLDDPYSLTVEGLYQRLMNLWARLFQGHPDRETLVRQGMITPACGLGLLNPQKASRIYRLTSGLSRRLREGQPRRQTTVSYRSAGEAFKPPAPERRMPNTSTN
ncbi:conserved hypothetical protein [Desulfosarcina cetonica]|uniref:hypothetical protein n=1 Tax=Desulfosarcina cetonica TaxID=90730 RepID=UPI0015813F95|nr:hypothetical protein [Desulfosarcina cetonica]VTR64273.1 conserved hypothetical protein [Desulfosarcina cetonica]